VGRLARVIAVGVAHHVTQRGNGRRFLLDSDADRPIYFELLQENLRLHEVLLITAAMSSKLPVRPQVIPSFLQALMLSRWLAADARAEGAGAWPGSAVVARRH
jgi:hypothetical protein